MVPSTLDPHTCRRDRDNTHFHPREAETTYNLSNTPWFQLSVTKEDLQKRVERDKKKEKRHAEMPDIVIKVVCRYRAELFFKISRKTKLARLFTAWTERMDARSYVPMIPETTQKSGDMLPKISTAAPVMQFLFTHMGRGLELDQTPEDAGMEDGDEILAVEMMDLTGPDVVRAVYGVLFFHLLTRSLGGNSKAREGSNTKELVTGSYRVGIIDSHSNRD